jgi:hypothetical protein
MGLGMAFTPWAHAEALKKEEVEEMIASLASIREAVAKRNFKQNGVAMRAFQEHGSSPVSASAFYQKCLKKLRFTDEGKRAEAWRTYRENQDAVFNSVYHRVAKQLELKYLVLTIQAVEAEDRREMMKPLVAYIDDLLRIDGRGYQHIDGIGDSLFVEIYGIENSIDPGDWESDPTNIQGIYDQGILPHMRKHRDPRLVTAWRSKIDHMKRYEENRKEGRERDARERARALQSARGRGQGAEFRAEAREEVDPWDTFLAETLPEMRWEMCEDLVEHGFQAEALPLMFDVIREHPEYPQLYVWLNSLEAELQKALVELSGGALPLEGEATE